MPNNIDIILGKLKSYKHSINFLVDSYSTVAQSDHKKALILINEKINEDIVEFENRKEEAKKVHC